MNKKALILSILAAGLIVLASFSSVVGNQSLSSNDEKKCSPSPLFTIRTKQFLNKDTQKKVTTDYLGKGRILNLKFLQKTSLDKWIDKAFKIIDTKPHIFHLIVERIATMPEFINVLKEYNMDRNDFKNQIYQIINDPIVLKEKIDEVKITSPSGDDPLPLGLSTSSAIGCLIIILIVGPIFALIAAIIATMTILTCLFPGCFEEFVGGFLESFIQGLTPPEYS